jgi:hypothetical protein
MKMPRKTISRPEEIQPAFQWAYQLIVKGLSAGDVDLVLHRPSRSESQNDKFHPMVRDIARHIDHPILGKNEDQWRYFLLALFQDQLMVPSLDGQKFVFVPTKSSSRLTIGEASEFIEFLYATGAEHGVAWSEPSLQAYDQYRKQA